jgi:hypothetical protein
MIVVLIVVGLVAILLGAWVISALKLNKELENNKEE